MFPVARDRDCLLVKELCTGRNDSMSDYAGKTCHVGFCSFSQLGDVRVTRGPQVICRYRTCVNPI